MICLMKMILHYTCMQMIQKFREKKSDNDVHILQEDLRKMSIWSDKWLLKFPPQNMY